MNLSHFLLGVGAFEPLVLRVLVRMSVVLLLVGMPSAAGWTSLAFKVLVRSVALVQLILLLVETGKLG